MSGILGAILVALLAWLVLRSFSGGAERRSRVEEAARRATEANARRQGALGEDMRECEVCGTFRAVSAREPCGREDCPYR